MLKGHSKTLDTGHKTKASYSFLHIQQILTVMCGRLLRKVPIFQNRDENFINALLFKLDYEVFLEGDVIIRRNVPGDRMFFIDHGQAVMETESEERELCDGDFFGGQSNLSPSDHAVAGASAKVLPLFVCYYKSCASFRAGVSLSYPFFSLILAWWYVKEKENCKSTIIGKNQCV